MEVGMVGLGRMGLNMAIRLGRAGHAVHGTARSAEGVREAEKHGVRGAHSLAALVQGLTPPRVVWLMIPVGDPVEQAVGELETLLTRGDTVVDGGNSWFRDSVRRAARLEKRGIEFVDSGTSGGVWGLEVGYCLMLGGREAAVERVAPLCAALAPRDGWRRVGPPGAGHFVKMVHNAIEYGMLQAYAEGFELLEDSDYDLDLRAVAALWGQGGVVRSWLLELLERALAEDPKLEKVDDFVEDSGMGRWTVQEAVARAVPAPVLTLSLMSRFRSRQEASFAAKVVASLRKQFGGHAVRSPS